MVSPCPSARHSAIGHGAEALFRASILPGRLPVTTPSIKCRELHRTLSFTATSRCCSHHVAPHSVDTAPRTHASGDRAHAHGPPLTHGAVEVVAPPSKPPLACVLHPSDRHLCRGAASQSWPPRPLASVRPRRKPKPPSKCRSSTSISIFRDSGYLVWPLWRASGRESDPRSRVWRTGNPSAGRSRAQITRADDPGVSGPAERCRWAARSVACG